MTAVLSPSTPEEAAAALAEASRARESVSVVGGGTRSRRGRPRQAPDRELRTAGLRAVVAHEPADLTLTIGGGLPVVELAELAASGGQCWPQAEVRPGSTVGGVLAAAASGRRRLRSGAVRDSLLQVVLATGDGRLVTAGGRTVKGVSGFDLCRLSVGSLGTLGVIVQATLKLWPIPAAEGWFGMEAPLPERLAAAERALTGPGRPASVLLAPGRLAVELAGPADDVRPPDGMTPLPEAPEGPEGRGIVEAGVPPPRLGDLAKRLEGAALAYEARLGVGTCLVAVERPGEVDHVRAWALELGGHAVVIDGPDDLRADPWGPEPPGVHLMRRLRDAFDPAGVLNRGMVPWA